MDEVPEKSSAEASVPAAGCLIAMRFLLLTGALGVFVAGLACLELRMLRWLGIGLPPAYRVKGSGVHGFSISPDGRWGVSRLTYAPEGLRAYNRHDLLLHDLQNPHRAAQVGWQGIVPRQAAVASSGDRIALISGTDLFLCRSPWTSPSLHRLGPAGSDAVQLAWSHDDRWIGAAAENTLSIWQRSGELTRHLQHDGGAPLALAFSDDGRRLLLAARDGAYRVWDVETGRQHQTVQLGANASATPAFSGDLRTAAFTGSDGSLWIRTDGKLAQLGPATARSRLLSRRLSLAEDAALLAVADCVIAEPDSPERRMQRRIWIWDLRSGEVVQKVPPSDRDVENLSFLHGRTLYVCDGKEVRSWSFDEGRELWRFHCEDWMRTSLAAGELAGLARSMSRGRTASYAAH